MSEITRTLPNTTTIRARTEIPEPIERIDGRGRSWWQPVRADGKVLTDVFYPFLGLERTWSAPDAKVYRPLVYRSKKRAQRIAKRASLYLW